ncbi:EamA family transporter [uncultured Methylibium sp.]|uniref:EamA family transporter n=1 Tax=uncultured Methylibium sp. TaxID=381093 RepID=UPI0025DC011B|nr:EamA family transporter [uncultured Methylibium sp.]
MRLDTLLLILGSVLMATTAQLLLKIGMSDAGVRAAVEGRQWGSLATQLIVNHWVVVGLSLYVLGALLWLLVLAKVELSFAYPFVGLGFVVTMLLGWGFMGDTLGVQRVVGTLLITLGVVLVARGG